MFDISSRYFKIETTELSLKGQRVVVYKRRRFLPLEETFTTLAEVTLNDGDRLDLIAARTLGVSEQFWRICDANNALNPFDLIKTAGQILRIPIPHAEV